MDNLANPLGIQVGGRHYADMKIQPVEFINANQFQYCEGNIVKYVSRWRHKGGIEDLRKASHYMLIILSDAEYTRRFSDLRSHYGHAGMAPERYCRENGITGPEKGVITHLWLWNAKGTRYDLRSAGEWLDELITTETREATG